RWDRTLSVAAHVRRHRPVAGLREGGKLVAPRVRELGEAVAEDHGAPLPLLRDAELDAVGGDRALPHPLGANATARARRNSLMCSFAMSGRASAIRCEPPPIVLKRPGGRGAPMPSNTAR